jgi:hypothetical protein
VAVTTDPSGNKTPIPAELRAALEAAL